MTRRMSVEVPVRSDPEMAQRVERLREAAALAAYPRPRGEGLMRFKGGDKPEAKRRG